MSINNRLEQLIIKTATTRSNFSKATGISTVILSHIGSGRNKVSLAAVEQILMAYPEVNSEWLVLGKGRMFKQGLNEECIAELEARLDAVYLEVEKTKRAMDVSLNTLKATISKLKG